MNTWVDIFISDRCRLIGTFKLLDDNFYSFISLNKLLFQFLDVYIFCQKLSPKMLVKTANIFLKDKETYK